MKTLSFIIVMLCALPLHSNAQSSILSKEESAKYIQVVSYTLNKILTLQEGESDGQYWTKDSCTFGTNGYVKDGNKISLSVEKNAIKVDGSKISRISFYIRRNDRKTKYFPMEIIYFNYNHLNETGSITWIIKNSVDEPFKIHVGSQNDNGKNLAVETINWHIDHLSEYLK